MHQHSHECFSRSFVGTWQGHPEDQMALRWTGSIQTVLWRRYGYAILWLRAPANRRSMRSSILGIRYVILFFRRSIYATYLHRMFVGVFVYLSYLHRRSLLPSFPILYGPCHWARSLLVAILKLALWQRNHVSGLSCHIMPFVWLVHDQVSAALSLSIHMTYERILSFIEFGCSHFPRKTSSGPRTVRP